MDPNENDLSLTLPEELRRQFADVQRRLWRVESTIALGWIVAGLAVSLLGLFISDRLWNTTTTLRILFALLGLNAIIIPLGFWAPTLDLAPSQPRRPGQDRPGEISPARRPSAGHR